MGRRRRRRRRSGRAAQAAAQPTTVQVPTPVSPIKPSGLKLGLGGNFMKNLQLNVPQKQPVFFEDWDVNDDGELNVVDAQGWAAKGREDLAKQVATMIGSGNMPAKRPIPKKPTKKQAVKKVYGIPKIRWAKLKPAQRKAVAKRFQRSAKAKIQSTRRQMRMFRGAARLGGAQPDSVEQGRLRRTSRRMHRTLEKARMKRRIRRGIK